MLRLMLLGLVAGMFFSATFIFNRAISLEGGHWYWSAALRYLYMVLFLGAGIRVCKGGAYLRRVLSEFQRHWKFWIVSGSIGFGGFYALICFAADHSPGWVVATTWQMTIIATLFVLKLFGKTFSKKIWLYSAIVFIGVFLVNISEVESESIMTLLLGASPVLVAAFLYPLGNQLVWEAKHGRKGLPGVDAKLLDNAFAKVFLLSIGSIPFWILLFPFTDATIPSHGQLVNVALVALFSGVIATSLFLSARNGADNASKLAAVDATQSSEVVFALAGEVLFLQASLPNMTGTFGMLVACVGLIAFVRHEHD
ncbi:MAG: multidrug resistance efflux transporter family protein [Desulfuromonadales bacterium]|nr:multidrug resistance efflux transporter family protein [Desulfuromonadales bacterium]